MPMPMPMQEVEPASAPLAVNGAPLPNGIHGAGIHQSLPALATHTLRMHGGVGSSDGTGTTYGPEGKVSANGTPPGCGAGRF